MTPEFKYSVSDAMFNVAVPLTSGAEPSETAPVANDTVPAGVLPAPVTWAVSVIGCATRVVDRLLEIVVTLGVPAAAAGCTATRLPTPVATTDPSTTNAPIRALTRITLTTVPTLYSHKVRGV